jgi:Protein of unknown function (DUF3179)
MRASRKPFYVGVILWAVFELAAVWFIMPLPFSQRTRSIDVAYALHAWRWPIRALCAALIIAGIRPAWRAPAWRRWIAPASLATLAAVVYATNVTMAADHMFVAPSALRMVPAARSVVERNRLVVGVELGGEARAYPVQFLGYHHQVRDTVGGRPVLVSYCTVCRTGRVFEPVVDGHAELFRLVGMDHFNAMFEDRTTGSWWRQANGEAIAGPKTGTRLRELPSRQVALAEWLVLHPNSLIMQPDSALARHYAKGFDYETGASRGALTGTDTVSWRDKAWVVGLTVHDASRAYDWNRLKRERVINDSLGGEPVLLVLAPDGASFFAYERPDAATRFSLRGDSLVAGAATYSLGGRGPSGTLAPLFASQEFWHSWREFNSGTTRY